MSRGTPPIGKAGKTMTFEVNGSVALDAAGGGQIRFEGPGEGDWWIERAIFVRQGVGTGEFVSVYVGSVDALGFRDATVAGTFPAVADENMPIRIPPFTPFFGVIAGGTAGDVFTVTMQIRESDKAALAEDLSSYGKGAPDSMLNERGFPNQNRVHSGRR